MTSDKKKPTPKELFNEILKHPAYVNELTEYQTSKVLEYVADQIDQCSKRVMELLSADYDYPDDVDDDKKADYWFNRSSKYKDAKRVKAIIEGKVKTEYNIKTESPKKEKPWNRIDGTARTCINSWIDENRFTGNNAEVAKAFLVSFEIRSKQQHGKVFKGKTAPTVRKVIEHETYPYPKGEISNRTLQDYLTTYWDNWRDPSKVKGK